MSQLSGSSDSLPKQFVSAMRTLFDIMDDRGVGYVKLSDIENRWRDDRTTGLPKGVIESLQKTASPEGLLTFDRFCTGLKICLIRNQADVQSKKVLPELVSEGIHGQLKAPRPPSAPLLDIDDSTAQFADWKSNIQNSETTAQHRTISMPQLVPRNEVENVDKRHFPPKESMYGPPKPPRVERKDNEKKDSNLVQCVREETGYNVDKCVGSFDMDVLRLRSVGRGPGDGKAAEACAAGAGGMCGTRRARGRREPRRHTLHNGVDYNLLKRMKQIEQEKDILDQGLAAIEKARDWYIKQLAEVQEKMRYVSRMGAHVEQWTEAQQERVELQRARVLELNRQLGALADSWHRGGLSLHMNLALPPVPRAQPAAGTARPLAPSAHHAHLKRQNILLTEEVTKKTERITVLEREKTALVRELLAMNNRNKNDHIY